MSDNGMGGRRVGKKYFKYGGYSINHLTSAGKNVEEDSDYSTPPGHGRLSEWEQLIADYNDDNKFIRAQKRKWLPPKKRK